MTKAEEKQAREDAKHAPVSLPAGSYDADKLQSGLDAAVDKQSGNRDDEVAKAVGKARDGESTTTGAPNALPGHKLVRAEVLLAPGQEVGEGKDKETVGEVRIEEYRQVYDPKSDDADTTAAATVSGVGLGEGGKSEIVSLEDVDPQDLPAAIATGTGPGAAVAAGAGASVGTSSVGSATETAPGKGA